MRLVRRRQLEGMEQCAKGITYIYIYIVVTKFRAHTCVLFENFTGKWWDGALKEKRGNIVRFDRRRGGSRGKIGRRVIGYHYVPKPNRSWWFRVTFDKSRLRKSWRDVVVSESRCDLYLVEKRRGGFVLLMWNNTKLLFHLSLLCPIIIAVWCTDITVDERQSIQVRGSSPLQLLRVSITPWHPPN